MRQYKDFIFFERAEPPRFMREAEFDFARSEDKDATSEAKIERLRRGLPGQGAQERGQRRGAARRSRPISRASRPRSAGSSRPGWPPSRATSRRSQAFAERAYRRPLSRAERDDLLAFYRELRAAGRAGPRRRGARHGRQRADVAPLLLPRRPGRGGRRPSRPLSDYALASRLSYFLWSSMPDDELLAHAAAGDLHQPDVLVAQARRMLRDDRVRGLATEFGGNWLDFRRFEEHNGVDRERFPSFTDELRQAMFEEPIRFFVDVVQPGSLGARSALRRSHVRQPGPGPALRHARPERRARRVGPRRRRAPLRPRRPAADGGLPDQERAGPAHQPGEARLLGRPPAAGRADPARRRRRSPSCPRTKRSWAS